MIDVMIVTFNSSELLAGLAQSVRESSEYVNRIWICDNGSSDDTVAFAQSLDWGRPASVYAANENLGFGQGHNFLARMASDSTASPFMLIVNPDVNFRPRALASVLRTMEENADIGCAGLSLSTSDGSPVSSARKFPSARAMILSRPENVQSTETVMTDWICGAFMLWRREAFDAVGGFFDGYFLYFEDVDICRAVQEFGWKVAFCPQAEAIHDQGHGRPTTPFLENISRRSRRLYCSRWMPTIVKNVWLIADAVDAIRRFRRGLVSGNQGWPHRTGGEQK